MIATFLVRNFRTLFIFILFKAFFMFGSSQNFPATSSCSQEESIERVAEVLDDYGKVQTRRLSNEGSLVVKTKKFSGVFYNSYLQVSLKWKKYNNNYSVTITPQTSLSIMGWLILVILLFSLPISFIFPFYWIFVILWLFVLILRPYIRSRKLKKEVKQIKDEILQILYN